MTRPQISSGNKSGGTTGARRMLKPYTPSVSGYVVRSMLAIFAQRLEKVKRAFAWKYEI
jgi:hypothetical protein